MVFTFIDLIPLISYIIRHPDESLLYRIFLSILYEYPIWRTVIYCQNNDLLYVTQNRIVRISVCHMKSVSFDLTWLPFILYAYKTYKCWLILINVYDLPVWITYITHSYGTPSYSAIPLFHIPIITWSPYHNIYPHSYLIWCTHVNLPVIYLYDSHTLSFQMEYSYASPCE